MPNMTTQRIVKLTPLRISYEHIDRKISCIRAHRERIFCVSTEYVGNKLICHNYGQGGAGWTFLFGCVHESIRQYKQQMECKPELYNKPIVVIGAGCYGLLTAILLVRQGYTVRIIAAQTQAISSYNAAGFFFPRPRKSATAQEAATFLATGIESYNAYKQIIDGVHPFITQGARLLPCYFGLDIDPGLGPYITQGIIDMPEKVTIDFGNGKRYEVVEYKTLFIDATVMMEQLQQVARELNITITQARVDTFNDCDEQIIFNCTGLGAKNLANDTRMVPVQGHLIMLKHQADKESLQYMLNVKVLSKNLQGNPRDELIYYAPKESGILGITFIRGQDCVTANQHEFDRLLQRSIDFFGE